MSPQTPTVLEIDRKLRDDFRRRVKDFGVSTETTDPLLAVLFRTVAQQIDQVYGDTAQLRRSLLHELMRGLEVEQYLARPAQATVRFANDGPEPCAVRAGTELNAVAGSGERLVFSLDAGFEVSRARIAFAFSYQEQSLRLLSGVEVSEQVQALRPSPDPFPIALGPQPALYLAVENLPASLLNRHGLYFELGPGTYPVQHALCREPWWIFGQDGELSGDGLLRPERINGGVYRLSFQTGRSGEESSDAPLPSIPDGFYSGRQFVLPPMSPQQRFLCGAPRLLAPALSRLVSRDADRLLGVPRLWVKIPMPPGVPTLHHAINGIFLHTMTASNVFTRNQTVRFAADGTSIPLAKEGGTPERLVAPLSVTGIGNEVYRKGNSPGSDRSAFDPSGGRWEIANGRLTLHPGHHSDGSPHEAANVRLWLTNGALGNRVGPGDFTGFAHAATPAGLRILPFTAAAGGMDGEDMAAEERRFADALLTRGRIVTRADLETAARAMDRRILEAEASSGIERRGGALRRVEQLRLTLDTHGFTKPEIELPALQSQIELTLGARLVQGLLLEVRFTWN